MNEFKFNQLYVFKKSNKTNDSDGSDDDLKFDKNDFSFDLVSRIKLLDIDIFQQGVCIKFHFLEQKKE